MVSFIKANLSNNVRTVLKDFGLLNDLPCFIASLSSFYLP